MWIVSLSLFILTLYLFYIRYVPVKGVKCLSSDKLMEKEIKIDLRDYNDSAKEMNKDTIPLPIAYIKRYHHRLPGQEIYVIVSNTIEKNLGIRLLERYGHKVEGYTIINKKCFCRKRLAKTI